MKVLIISDSHGRNDDVAQVMEQVGTFDMMIHLGDVERGDEYIRSIAKCPPEQVHFVSGNNDYNLDLPYEKTIDIEGYRVLLTHGHRFYVNGGISHLREYAVANHYDIAMFGHTHVPYLGKDEDVKIINPGSISYPRQADRKQTFLIMELSDASTEPEFKLGYLKSSLKEKYGNFF